MKLLWKNKKIMVFIVYQCVVISNVVCGDYQADCQRETCQSVADNFLPCYQEKIVQPSSNNSQSLSNNAQAPSSNTQPLLHGVQSKNSSKSIADLLEQAKKIPVADIHGLSVKGSQLLQCAYAEYIKQLNNNYNPTYALSKYASVIDIIIHIENEGSGGVLSYVMAPFTNIYYGIVKQEPQTMLKGIAGLSIYVACFLIGRRVIGDFKSEYRAWNDWWQKQRPREHGFNQQPEPDAGDTSGSACGVPKRPKNWDETCYGILEIEKKPVAKISLGDIKKAYKKCALIYHPDRPGANTEKFLKIGYAHNLLSDTDKRRIYDNLLPEYLRE